MVVVGVGPRTAAKHTIGRCHNEHSALMASARVTVHDSRHPIRLTRVALLRSADCPVCCVAGCQSAAAPVLKRHPLATVHRADWQSAKQRTRLSALLFIAACALLSAIRPPGSIARESDQATGKNSVRELL